MAWEPDFGSARRIQLESAYVESLVPDEYGVYALWDAGDTLFAILKADRDSGHLRAELHARVGPDTAGFWFKFRVTDPGHAAYLHRQMLGEYHDAYGTLPPGNL